MTDTATTTSSVLPEGWGMVIGLEVHCELHTATKLFCSCPNQFGDEPNANTCPTCLGLPGSLPVVNEQAVELAMRLGRALQCEVNRSVFARKNYFYPDQPKDYQVSQYDLPTNEHGHLELPSGLRVGITRAHIEEDTGKLNHVGGGGRIHDAAHSLVDYNRSGVPLVEIVSEPDMRSSEQAKEYVAELRSILLATGVSDAKMEEGSMRVDANVSVHRVGEPWGTRCEIKNLNSLRSLGRAIDHEALRQIDLIEAGEQVRQETRHWDESTGRTGTLRVKEDADDYRYFPEPDLVPLEPTPEDIARIDAALPALPAARRAALAETAGVDPTDNAVVIAVQRGLDALAAGAIAAGADAARVLTHVEHNLAVEGAESLPAEHLAALVQMETGGELTATQAKAVLAEMVTSGQDPAIIAQAKGFEALDTGALEAIVDGVIAAHPAEWEQFRTGDDKARGKLTGFFMGKVMQASKGQADGKAATALLRTKAGL
ncbi:MAG TPA: Asp-tRNA(Asn)/Glu-tRNA(Gln) amidotransferase subunit GatB [Acidimicrobiales bacterium]|nr:Asp-tRNA(Asn)/Glu-tRNA(Gln) amidotransferase subunit GatB [Acidimicrobiales bacterium]